MPGGHKTTSGASAKSVALQQVACRLIALVCLTVVSGVQARGVPLASNQVQFSILYRAPERNGVLAACKELGVTLIAYSPMAQGLLTGAPPPRLGCRLRDCTALAPAAMTEPHAALSPVRSSARAHAPRCCRGTALR
jgi:aryl-alcohol dehydrogenase-like predicted oxidoreductase